MKVLENIVKFYKTSGGAKNSAGLFHTQTGEKATIDKKYEGFPPGHFYSPLVDIEAVRAEKERIWGEGKPVFGIDFNDDSQIEILEKAIKANIALYQYPDSLKDGEEERSYYNSNSQFGWLDSRALFGMVLYKKPKRVIEIGSGYSSLLTADVNFRFFSGAIQFSCIEPYPREFLKQGIPGLTSLIDERVELISIDYFDSLQENDILFVDSSHVSKTGSDVNYIVFEIIPRLKAGVFIHFHDVFLPDEYPQHWVLGDGRSWNEQYIVRAMLMYTNKFKVIFGSSYAYKRYPDLVQGALALPNGKAFGGSSFWIQKT